MSIHLFNRLNAVLQNRGGTCGLMLTFLLLVPSWMTPDGQTVRLKDHSDWWSILNENFRSPDARAQNKDIDARHFQIAGVTLGSDQVKDLEAKVGKAKRLERGDASSGREQVCYVPADDQTKIHLIFEFGEVESTFYLFVGGSDWRGSGLCAKSKQVSMSSGTASGLKLGITRDQLEAILGKPDVIIDERLIYSRKVEKRTTPEEFETLRKEYPQKLSDKAAHERFDFQTVVMYIEARFANSKLTYLAVSRTS